MPQIDDSLDQLCWFKLFSTLDLASGHCQVGMSEESQKKTASVTWKGYTDLKLCHLDL